VSGHMGVVSCFDGCKLLLAETNKFVMIGKRMRKLDGVVFIVTCRLHEYKPLNRIRRVEINGT
jgi:hypothetical protein